MASLAEIRAKLQEASSRGTGQGSGGDNSVFPHWDAPDNSTTTVRFLPDGDANNPFFWVERLMIRLPFAGIKGEVNSKPTFVQVPCMEMWQETCPILTEVRTWFKDKDLEEMGRKYWKKKSYLFQGFVIDSKLSEEKVPENPIRRFVISTQIFNIIKNALMDSEIDELPTDYLRGLDFKITKAQKGGYADYTTSNWARRERALSESELEAINQYGLYDLKTFLPKKPTDAELKIMMQMFEASVDGEPFDMEKWGNYFKPAGMNSDQPRKNTAPAADSNQSAKPTSSEDDESSVPWANSKPAEEPAPTTTGSDASKKAHDILAQIRNRQAAG